jgi:TolB-like protein/Tfp pilus assembly protein PilF
MMLRIVSVAAGRAGAKGNRLRSFFSELTRRNVYKIGAMYAVGGWLFVQIVTQVFPVFEISALVQRAIVLMIVAGFPIALVLSWVYELTPEGIVRTGDVEPGESITHRTGQRLNYVIIGILVVAVAFLLAQRYLFPPRAIATVADVPEKSIAVLPFENLSEDKANEFFAEGIQDEILTRLAKIGALKVISRTSTQHYASSPNNLPEIAKQLGVANILEGSVQKVGDAVHINVQLIRAATDDHLWAEIYNRKLTDIFGMQGEVANAIALALNAKLSGTEQAAVSSRPTENLAAYEAFLRGRSLNLKGYDYNVARKTADSYAEAVRLDPQFAQAWSYLAMSAGYLYFNGIDRERFTGEFVKHAADTALALQPNSSEAQLAQGDFRYHVLRDFPGALPEFIAATQRSPNDSLAFQLLGFVERRLGKWDDAVKHLVKASSLDPLDAGLMTAIGGETFANMRQFDEARVWLDRALVISPGSPLATMYKGMTYQNEGRLVDADRIFDSVSGAGIDAGLAQMKIYQSMLKRDFASAIAQAQAQLARPADQLDNWGAQIELDLAAAQTYAGQTAQAQQTLQHLIGKLTPHADQVDDSILPVVLAQALAFAGKPKEALAQANHALALYANDGIFNRFSRDSLAHAQLVSGDRAAAIATLSELVSGRVGSTAALVAIDPMWDALHSDPGFQALIKQ